MRFLCVVILWFVFGVGQAVAKKLAVLEFNGVGVDKAYLELLTDSARGGALEVGRGEGIEIYTRENMLMMLSDMGMDAECIEGSCEVEIARNISADYVVSGKVTKSGSYLILQLKLHETKGGTLLATEELESADQQSLRRSVKPKSIHLLRSGLGLSGGSGVVGIEEDRLSDDAAVRFAQLERQRADMLAAQQARQAELERQLEEQRRFEAALSQAESDAKRPYQEKAGREWLAVSEFAQTQDPMGKAALELFIAEYKDVRVKVGSKEIKVDIPEVQTARQQLSSYRYQAYVGYENWQLKLGQSSSTVKTTQKTSTPSSKGSDCVGCEKEGRLAVLEFQGIGLKGSDLEVLTDSARSGALEISRDSGIEIYTRENMLMMLKDKGKSADCVEGSCEVEIARNISADYVVSGKVTKSGTVLVLLLKLHETRGGTLLATEELEGADMRSLRHAVPLKSSALLQSGLGLSGGLSALSAEVEGMSGQLLSNLEKLKQARREMVQAEEARLAELERVRALQLKAMAPYQAKAREEWQRLKVAAKRDYAASKPALEAFIAEYGDIRVAVEGEQIKVEIQELAEAEQLFRFGLHEGFETVVVPGGTFMMGCLPNDRICYYDAKPRHKVTISHTLEVMTTEVTQGLYESVMGSNPSRFNGSDRPVEQVSWYDAVAFANALSRKEGLSECYRISGTNVTWSDANCNGWRLPTEAEWEYLARGGEEYKYSGSNRIRDVAWYQGNSRWKTHPVGQKSANGFGLHDMTGNVWEWTWDWYGDYSSGSVTDPRGPSSGSRRVFRGGGCQHNAWAARASNRNYYDPSNRDYDLGFRLLRKKI